ncbi:MauE/DoxX family redox-associated membrane protein [Flavobacterium ardleyense]|uniref:MauE/DoxX family redox-associated membrane protein n=1 Tax=Flavobacterium ardleyense TaxID=2038737 RepID=A0ABW5ZAZ0_9FLAO
MRLSVNIRFIILELICLLYILLFVYAAVSKLLDFENFQVQLGQSPMLREFVLSISYGIPVLELVLASLLLFPKTKVIGLYGAFGLMTSFSIYLFILITYSDYIPCSCGGILEKMGWEAHLLFNILFVILAIIAIRIYGTQQTIPVKSQLKILLTLFVISLGFVTLQYFRTDEEKVALQHFIRHYPHHPIELAGQMDLQYNSYYLAGFQEGKIYLGNVTAPLSVKVIDIHTYQQENYIINLPTSNLRFHSLKLLVAGPYFYFYDGTTSVVFRGSITNWKASQWLYNVAYFTHMIPIDSSTIAIKALSNSTNENVLGLINKKDSVNVSLYPKILEKQVDGVFDTDGIMTFNSANKQLVYTYFYRNEFIVISPSFKSHLNYKTIDQTEIAQVKTVTLKKKNRKVLAAQPLTVNKNSTCSRDYVLIQSGIIGNYEPKDTWNTSSTIDVYSLLNGSYQFSFYIPHQKGKALRNFSISDSKIIAINGQYLTVYQLKSPF